MQAQIGRTNGLRTVSDQANNQTPNSKTPQAPNNYQLSLIDISQSLQQETERGKRKYEENQRKIDEWREDAKVHFEMSDEDEDDDIDQQKVNNGDGNNLSENITLHMDPQEKLKAQQLKAQQQSIEADNTLNRLLECSKVDANQNSNMNNYATKNNSDTAQKFLQAKISYLNNKRKNVFKEYQEESSLTLPNPVDHSSASSTSGSSNQGDISIFESILKENTDKAQRSANAKNIENQLLRLTQAIQCPTLPQDGTLENYLFKKFKINKDSLLQIYSQTAGLQPGDFRKLKKYKINPAAMPFCGSDFAEAKKALVPQYHAIFTGSSNLHHRNRNGLSNNRGTGAFGKPGNLNQFQTKIKNMNSSNESEDGHNNNGHTINTKTNHNNNHNSIDYQTSPLRNNNSSNKLSHHESYATWEEILEAANHPTERDLQKKRKLDKINNMSAEDKNKYLHILFKRAWQTVVRNMLQTHRFAQQIDQEQNSRKYAILSSKEARKKYGKSQRTQKDWNLRGKKLHKEMVVYWRKRERELTEIKRRKDKLEAELKRREEEEKETQLQKKRLEFLMNQSELYAHFMAKKLGIAEHENTGNAEAQQPQQPQGQEGQTQLQITQNGEQQQQQMIPEGTENNSEAVEGVSAIINQRRQELLKFDLETAHERDMIGSADDKIVLKVPTDLSSSIKLDFSTVEPETQNSLVKPPEHFNGTLKEYQLKGLRWLDNLYEQGINGILADEMGLGKTIQAIALITHIAGTKNIWGPFLVIAPSSTLYNWQQELKKFFPALKVLPYWGSLKQRKMIRKYFSVRNLGYKSSPFHLVITSYQLIVSDEKTFQKIKWQYMILDEAQAIKNINSMRWKTLLSFNSRNKLLLTGTPIQNTMAELWALLHFIMPKLFDSHDQFQEWFSKDIEASSQDKQQLNQHQLQRLHAILKPFMLRRVKKDVEHELGAKKEFQLMCTMTGRQQTLYDSIKAKLQIGDFFKMFESRQKVDNLMNLVMQFRKVCNHPELFERRPCRSSYIFQNVLHYTGHLPPRLGEIKEVRSYQINPIQHSIPRLLYDDVVRKETDSNICKRLINLMDLRYIQEDLKSNKHSIFSFIRLLDLPINILEILQSTDQLFLQIVLLHCLSKSQRLFRYSVDVGESNNTSTNLWWSTSILHGSTFTPTPIGNTDSTNYDFDILKRKNSTIESIKQLMFSNNSNRLPQLYCLILRVQAPPIDINCSSASFQVYKQRLSYPKLGKYLLYGKSAVVQRRTYSEDSPAAPTKGSSLIDLSITNGGLCNSYENQESLSNIEVVDFASLVADSAKLKYLDKLLVQLKRDGHRVLIFCQMTRMIDILEDFMARKQYKYFRLDGSCNISDRRDMVNDFQTSDKTFIFLLSTRAGGLGVTLTAADVVIFYDNDWNPTMDAQAMDRAHRIGQKKEVQVYRLVIKGSIEERILKRAHQKQTVQSTVYSGSAFKADIWKPQEVLELFLDESELSDKQMFLPKRAKNNNAVGNGANPGQKQAQAKRTKKDKKPVKKEEKKKDRKGAADKNNNDAAAGESIQEEEGAEADDKMDIEGENGEDEEEEFGIDVDDIMKQGATEKDDYDQDNADNTD